MFGASEADNKGGGQVKLIFVRHGQTDWNRTHRIQGATDIPLNDTGIRQAEELKSLLEHTPIDCAVTSPLLLSLIHI